MRIPIEAIPSSSCVVVECIKHIPRSDSKPCAVRPGLPFCLIVITIDIGQIIRISQPGFRSTSDRILAKLVLGDRLRDARLESAPSFGSNKVCARR